MSFSALEREENYTSPEKLFKGLVLSPGHGVIPEDLMLANPDFTNELVVRGSPPEELCYVCGWTSRNEVDLHYQSHVRFNSVVMNVGVWELGHRWFVRDRPNDATLGNDFMTQEFLRSQPDLKIPLLKELRRLSAPTDKVHIELMSRAEGETLKSLWSSLSLEQKFTAPEPQKVDGSDLDDIFFKCKRVKAPACKQIGRTDDQWFENMKEELCYGLSATYKTEDLTYIEELFQGLKRDFPKLAPYVLTHADLNLGNILVKDNKIEAIIDWEYAGYFPWWVERLLGGFESANDAELADLVWYKCGLELDGISDEEFTKEIKVKIGPAIRAFDKCLYNTEHNNLDKVWYRPGFCKCRPYTGSFRGTEYGLPHTHNVKDKVLNIEDQIRREKASMEWVRQHLEMLNKKS